MVCPKCDEGKLKRIQFKRTGRRAHFCDFCGTMWLEEDIINELTGRRVRAYSDDEAIEYSIDVNEDADRESEPLVPVKYK